MGVQIPAGGGRNLLEEKDGLGVFLNPDEGKEIMSGFTTLLTGLRKKGEGLTRLRSVRSSSEGCWRNRVRNR